MRVDNVAYNYMIGYLPTSQNDEIKGALVQGFTTVNLKEPKQESFPVRYLVHHQKPSYEIKGLEKLPAYEIRKFENDFYVSYKYFNPCAIKKENESIAEYCQKCFSRNSEVLKMQRIDDFTDKSIIVLDEKEAILNAFAKRLENEFLYFNDEIWMKCEEPFYSIKKMKIFEDEVFLKISLLNSLEPEANIKTFNANERKEAIEFVKEYAKLHSLKPNISKDYIESF